MSQAVVLVLWAPYAPRLVHQMGRVAGYSWITAPDLGGVLRTELSVSVSSLKERSPLLTNTSPGR